MFCLIEKLSYVLHSRTWEVSYINLNFMAEFPEIFPEYNILYMYIHIYTVCQYRKKSCFFCEH